MNKKKWRRYCRTHRQYNDANRGQILEDIVYRLLKSKKEFYFSVGENIPYMDYKGVEGEIDVLAIRHKQNHRRYVVLVECKLSDRRTKASSQLCRARATIQNQYPDAKIFCIYVHNFNYRTERYTIEWLREL